MGSGSFLGRVVLKGWDRGKPKTENTYWFCRESWGPWRRSRGSGAGQGQYTAGTRWGLYWVPARATREGHTLLLWDFVHPNALIIAEGEREGSV